MAILTEHGNTQALSNLSIIILGSFTGSSQMHGNETIIGYGV